MNILTQCNIACLSKELFFCFFSFWLRKDQGFLLHWFLLSFPLRSLLGTYASDTSLIPHHELGLSLPHQMWLVPPDPHAAELVL